MQRRMPGMVAFIDQVLRRLMLGPNLYELLVGWVVLTEVGA